MIQQESRLKVTDNSGAKEILCIRVPKAKYARVGDLIVGTVKVATPGGNVKKGQVCRAVVVGTRKPIRRKNGQIIGFGSNTAVLVKPESKEPIATRVMGPVAEELRQKGFAKIISLAQEVV